MIRKIEVPADPVQRGFYLATLAHCMECHSRKPDGNHDYVNWWGIGAWSGDGIKKALTQGVGRDGRAFKPPMARPVYFSKLTEPDLNAIVAWVRTIPAAE